MSLKSLDIAHTEPAREVVDSPEMRKMNEQVAERCVVLLKNDNHTLPLHKDKIRTIGVIGPNADNRRGFSPFSSNTPSFMREVNRFTTASSSRFSSTSPSSTACFRYRNSEPQFKSHPLFIASETDSTGVAVPQAVGMAAAFDEDLMEQVGDAVSTEARAKFAMQQDGDDEDIYKGLTFWAPNVNIFRDPRWGRGHETFGEDPYLTSRLGVRYIQGLQGHDEVRGHMSVKSPLLTENLL